MKELDSGVFMVEDFKGCLSTDDAYYDDMYIKSIMEDTMIGKTIYFKECEEIDGVDYCHGEPYTDEECTNKPNDLFFYGVY